MSEGPCMCGALDCPSCGPAQGVRVVRAGNGFIADFDLEEVMSEEHEFTAADASDYFNSISLEKWDELMGMIARAVMDDASVTTEEIGSKIVELVKEQKREYESEE